MRVAILVCMVCMACGADPGPGPVTADGGGSDAARDVSSELPPGVTPICGALRLDCDGDRTCETPRTVENCRGCGLPCAAGAVCLTGLCVR